MWMILAAALLPVIVLFGYIWFKDREHPEPLLWLLRALFYGVLSAVLVIITIGPLPDIEVTSPFTAFLKAFLQAGIPEESAKLLMLWLLLRKNPHFDERLDGIVYASCIGLGFAALENILYLFGGAEDGSWILIGTGRALFSVPGHFCFGTLMGYFFARAWFGKSTHKSANYFCAWFVPVVAHGLYDGLIFMLPTVPEWTAAIVAIVFLVGFICLRRSSVKAINELKTEN